MRPSLFALAVAFFLATAALTIGCGSGTEALTLEEYFARFEAIDTEIDAQIDELYADFPEDASALTDDANLPYFKELGAAFTPIMADNIDRLAHLDPPFEVGDQHDELVAAGAELLAAYEEAAAVIAEAENMTEFETLNSEVTASLIEPISQFNAACVAVVDIATANDIAVTITCDG